MTSNHWKKKHHISINNKCQTSTIATGFNISTEGPEIQQVKRLSLEIGSNPYPSFLPTITAASAVCLANLTLAQEPWSSGMAQYSRYDQSDLQECLKELIPSAMPLITHSRPYARKNSRSKLSVAMHAAEVFTPAGLPVELMPQCPCTQTLYGHPTSPVQ